MGYFGSQNHYYYKTFTMNINRFLNDLESEYLTITLVLFHVYLVVYNGMLCEYNNIIILFDPILLVVCLNENGIYNDQWK